MRRLLFLAPALAALLATAALGPGTTRPADTVLRGGRVFVADTAGAVHSAIALRGDRILAVGSDADVASTIGPRTRVVELRGRLVTPGFNDAHLHFATGGISMLEVQLRGTRNLAEIEQRVREAAARTPAGEWITGRGWDHTLLPASELGPGGWPTNAVLDRAAPNHPVYLRRVDGHTAWANSVALRLAGIDARTPDPAGGEIVHDPRTGDPTGILKENAEDLVAAVVPPPGADRLRRGVEAALDLARRTGVTSVTTGAAPEDIELYQRLRDEGRLTVRVYAWLPLAGSSIDALSRLGLRAPFGDAWVRVGLLKGYVDGTLGSRTALMLEPFADDPSTRGIGTLPQPRLDSLVLAADRAGLQVALHAIGDAGNRLALDAIMKAQRANGARGARHRIEHAQVLDRADIPRFRELGVVASMQPTHATSDMRWVETRIGEARAREGAYVWRSLLDAGAAIAFGTDFAVEPLPPVEGLYSAVARQSRDEPGTPPGGWLPEQRLTMAEAIRLYSAGSAYAEFQEDSKGTLEAGKLADLVVWDRDLLTVPFDAVLGASPVMTIVGGRAVFER